MWGELGPVCVFFLLGRGVEVDTFYVMGILAW